MGTSDFKKITGQNKPLPYRHHNQAFRCLSIEWRLECVVIIAKCKQDFIWRHQMHGYIVNGPSTSSLEDLRGRL